MTFQTYYNIKVQMHSKCAAFTATSYDLFNALYRWIYMISLLISTYIFGTFEFWELDSS